MEFNIKLTAEERDMLTMFRQLHELDRQGLMELGKSWIGALPGVPARRYRQRQEENKAKAGAAK